MTTDQFVAKYEGKTIGFPGTDYLGECLSLCKQYIQEMYNIYPPASGCNGARCYWSLFPHPLGTVLKKIPNTPTLVPQKGWIAVWDENTGGGYGHIAIVLSASVDNFVSLDQNWNGRHAHKVTHDYKHVYGFLAPIKEGEDMISQEEYDKVRLERDKNWGLYQTQLKEVARITAEINQLTVELKECEKPVVDTGIAPVVKGWENNGLQVRVGDKTFNYSKK